MLGTAGGAFSLPLMALFLFLPDSSQQEHVKKGCPYRKSEIQTSEIQTPQMSLLRSDVIHTRTGF